MLQYITWACPVSMVDCSLPRVMYHVDKVCANEPNSSPSAGHKVLPFLTLSGMCLCGTTSGFGTAYLDSLSLKGDIWVKMLLAFTGLFLCR